MELRGYVAIVGVVLLLLAMGAALYLYSPSTGTEDTLATLPLGATHQVVLTGNGYEPKELTIAVGDTVIFSTVRGFPHWPASNIHPTHNQYPAFDPREPLLETETWEFQFTKAGVWQFHDHLNATYTGTITVHGS